MSKDIIHNEVIIYVSLNVILDFHFAPSTQEILINKVIYIYDT